MAISHFIAVPRFHSELLPAWMKDLPLCFPWAERECCLKGLPLNMREVQAVLGEWRSMDAGMLRQEIVHTASCTAHDDGLFPGEKAALEQFQGVVHAADMPQLREKAQRLLLMAWVQEERILEIRALNKRFAEQDARLKRLLSEEEDDGVHSSEETSERDDSTALLPPWRFMLESLAWFLPDDSALVVSDPLLTAELLFSGRTEAFPVREDPPLAGVLHLRSIHVSLNALLKKTLPDNTGTIPRLFLVHE